MNNPSTPSTAPDFAPIKARQQAAWTAGNYAVIGTTLQIVGEQLCETMEIGPADTVLDVAAGNGNASFEREQLRGAAAKSNEALRQLAPDIQWLESFVAGDKTFCVYLARDKAIIQRHAALSGFPVTTITEVHTTIDPSTASAT